MTKIEIGKSGFMPCQHINAVSEAGKKSDVDKKHYPSANLRLDGEFVEP